MTSSRASFAVLLAILHLACGGTAEVEGAGGGPGGAGAGGGAGGGAQGGGGAGGGGGASTCDALAEAYAEAIADARSCDTSIDVPQCTERVFTTLSCPCEEIFVNSANTAAFAELTALRTQWDDLECGADRPCPAIACESPTSGSCVPDGVDAFSGLCENDE
jgi:hypothetical protein